VLREEYIDDLARAGLIRSNDYWLPKPGDRVCLEPLGLKSEGIIIAVYPHNPECGDRALVLWTIDVSKGARTLAEVTRNMARQIADEQDNEIMKILDSLNEDA